MGLFILRNILEEFMLLAKIKVTFLSCHISPLKRKAMLARKTDQ